MFDISLLIDTFKNKIDILYHYEILKTILLTIALKLSYFQIYQEDLNN